MATESKKDNKLPQFATLKEHEKLAIIMRAEGKPNRVICNQINDQFDLSYKEMTVAQWFIADGRLEQPYLEYIEYSADQAVIRAKMKIKSMSELAASTLEELMSDKNTADNVRQQAAKTVLGKYIPDRQVIVDQTHADELPSELADIANDAIAGDEQNGGEDGPQQVDDAPQSADASGQDRAGGDENLPTALLPQSDVADGSGDTPA